MNQNSLFRLDDARFSDRRADMLAAKIPEDASEAERAARWLEAVEARVRAARAALKSVAALPEGQRHRTIRWARGRAKWAQSVLEQLPDLLAEALREEQPFGVIDGGKGKSR